MTPAPTASLATPDVPGDDALPDYVRDLERATLYLPADQRARIEGAFSPDDKATIDRLLAYPESAVGRLMTPKIWRCPLAVGGAPRTVGDAMDLLRAQADEIEVAVNCYVCDGAKLVGVVPLRLLAITDRQVPLGDIMTRDPLAVREDAARGGDGTEPQP